MFGKGGLGGLMKQAQQMQEKCKNAGRNCPIKVTGESGAGLVKSRLMVRTTVVVLRSILL